MYKTLIATDILNNKIANLSKRIDLLVEKGDNDILKEINIILSNRDILSHLITGIISNPDLFKKMLNESYYHENGFHKIVLLSGKFFKLRLHHFGSSAQIPMENIHDHRWPFASSILYGDLHMDMFNVKSKNMNSEKVHHFKYNSNKIDGAFDIDYLGIKYLEKSESRTYRPGETYLLRTDELHRIINKPGQESITIILTGKPISVECNLYAKRKIMEEEKQTKPYESKSLLDMLKTILEIIYPKNN